jgi:ParB/RepB/Spo0J family partition protein
MNLNDIKKVTKNKFTPQTNIFLELEIDKVFPNPNQPRKNFENIDELASSIVENGLIQPIAVVKQDGGYMIISGERRYRACKKIALKTIKAHVIQADNKKVRELSLIENIQRDDLTDFEKAKFIVELWSSGNYPQKQDLANAIGKPQSYISKAFTTIKICDEIVLDIEDNKKDVGLEILQELSGVKDKSMQLKLYQDGAKRDEIRKYKDEIKGKFSPAKFKVSFSVNNNEEWENVRKQITHLENVNPSMNFKITIEEI